MSRNDLLVLGLWCVVVLVLLSPVLAVSGAVFFNHGDLFTYHIPLRSLTASELQSGRMPFWDPYILLGVPHAANPQAALFYPAAILCALLPVARGLVWDQTLHLLWAGAGMFFLARAHRLGREAAFILASAFALSPFLIYRITAGIPTLLAALSWTPWLWLAWLSGSIELLAGGFALQLLSGHGQFLVVDAAAMFLWGLLSAGRSVLLRRLAVAGAATAALTAVQWALTAQYLTHSVRGNWTGATNTAYSLPLEALWTWVNPGALGTPINGKWKDALSVFYETCGGWIGPLALALAVYGLARGRRRGPAVLLASAGILLALGPRGPVSDAVLSLPVLSYLRTPSRWLWLTVWGGLLLAGTGLAVLRGRRWPTGGRLAAVLASFLPLAAWDAQFLRPQDPSFYLAASSHVATTLAGRAQRVLTDPELANPNKTILYRIMNVNGYEAFYPKGVPTWAAAAEGVPAADASRVFVTRWRSPTAQRAGVQARLSAQGIEQGPAWSLATYVDSLGRRVLPEPRLWIENSGRWRVTGDIPPAAAAVALAVPAYPGWRARLNGAPARTVLWDGLFQAVPLPSQRAAASLSLMLDFRPTGWSWLIGLTVAAWLAWLAVVARRAGAVP